MQNVCVLLIWTHIVLSNKVLRETAWGLGGSGRVYWLNLGASVCEGDKQ